MLFNEMQIRGLTTELICMTKLIEMGYIVSIPYGNNSRYDLLLDVGGQYFRLQCKTAHKNENDSYTINTSNTVSTTTQNRRKYYDPNDVDFIVSIIENQLIFISTKTLGHSASKIFRTCLPKHGTKSTCNLIENYAFDKQVLPLIAITKEE